MKRLCRWLRRMDDAWDQHVAGALAFTDDGPDDRAAREQAQMNAAILRHPAANAGHEDFGWCSCRRCESWDLELAAILEGGGA